MRTDKTKAELIAENIKLKRENRDLRIRLDKKPLIQKLFWWR